MMILLRGHSMEPLTKFQPEKLSLQLSERTSTATMTLSETAPEMACGDWMKTEDGPGAGIVWRIKTVEHNYEKRTRTVTLEHIIALLKDMILFDEVKAEDISGSSSTNPTNGAAVKYILDYQHDWVIRGIAGAGQRNPFQFSSGTTLFSALETVSSAITDSIWEYDMTGYPFILDIGHLTGEISSEMRTDRNIRTMKKTVDRSGMYTRFYPIGKDDLRITGDYVSKNEEYYGTICKSETDQSYETEDALLWWAQDKLARHAEPSVTISISGLDLANATGEKLDEFRIGYLCRVPLPEFGTTITERITKITYSDVINDPMNVTITLANELTDIVNIISSLASSVSGSAASSAKDNAEKNAWIDETNDHVYLVARAVAGEDENGVNWSRVAKLGVDGEGIHGQVTRYENEMKVAETRIEANEYQISLEATRRSQQYGELSGRISVQADRITAEVQRAQGAEGSLSGRIDVTAREINAEVTNRQNQYSSLSGRITVNSDKVSMVVTETGGGYKINTASVVASINSDHGSNVKINADTIDLTGYVTASELAAANARITNLTSGISTAGSIKVQNLYITTDSMYHQGHKINRSNLTIDGVTYNIMTWSSNTI